MLELFKSGFTLIDGFVDPGIVKLINDEYSTHKMESRRGGIRNADQKLNSIKSYLLSDSFKSTVQQFFDSDFEVIRTILFDKNPENNWFVNWHQDRTVAVHEKFESEGWGPWSIKDDVHHVQPPLEILNNMTTFRIHLDDATAENGCLQVIPRSHSLGILSQERMQEVVSENQPYVCEAKAGSALVMKPLLIHSSRKAITESCRRVLHVECGSFKLPKGRSGRGNPGLIQI